MEYFEVVKTKKKNKLNEILSLKDGYRFKHKLNITIYNSVLIENILTKKIDNTLSKIINMYELLDEDDSDGVEVLRAKIETLRSLLLSSYYKYISKKKLKSYLLKLDSIDNKVKEKFSKTRHR